MYAYRLKGKKVQAWDSVGQPAVETAKDSGRHKSFKKTEDFVPLAMTVASTTDSFQEKHASESLDCVSSSLLLSEAERFCRILCNCRCSPTLSSVPKMIPEPCVRHRTGLPRAWG